MTKLDKYWALLVVLLVVIIAAGGIIAWSRYSQSQPITISLAPPQESPGKIYVDGAVNNPGLYPFNGSDSLARIIRDAGGTTDGADLTQLRLHISRPGEGEQPQKVNVNRAEAWLLQSLPGIGEVRAQAIIEYRRKNGPFRDTNELTRVEGIGTTAYERIKNLIAVSD